MWKYVLIVVLFVGGVLAYVLIELKKKGVFKSDRRELDLAMANLSRQLRRNPNDGAAYLKRGLIRHRKGDRNGALSDLIRTLELEPANAEAHYRLGLLLNEIGRKPDAERHFTWVMENSQNALYMTAINELRMKRAAGRKG